MTLRAVTSYEPDTRAAMLDAAKLLLGAPCVWGGEDGNPDCSGVVRSVRRVGGIESRKAPDYTSRDIWKSWPAVEPGDVTICDLALYGYPVVHHVMLVAGPWYYHPLTLGVSEWVVPVIGASGARPWIRTVAQARKHGAAVKLFSSHLYRNNGKLGGILGFRGFRRMPEFAQGAA